MTKHFQDELIAYRSIIDANTLHIFDAGSRLRGYQLKSIIRLIGIDLRNSSLKLETVLEVFENWDRQDSESVDQDFCWTDLVKAPFLWARATVDIVVILVVIIPMFLKQTLVFNTPFERMLTIFILGALSAKEAPTAKL